MHIWFIDHYGVPPIYKPLARQTNFAKCLIEMGHTVKIFAASTPHNTNINLIDENITYKEVNYDGVNYVLVKCHRYQGNGIKRILNMFEFAFKLPGICKQFDKPDAIVSTSMTPLACAMGLKIGMKLKCKNIAQITDLWPETLVAYNAVSKYHPAVLFLRRVEKWIYKTADRIIFSMEGGYDYIKEQGWDKEIQRAKVCYINNGVYLEQFDYNKEHFIVQDEDLRNENIFKVIYTGSVRRVNNLGKLLDVAKLVTNPKVKFLIWGDGDDLKRLKERINVEKITNVSFKGRVEKKYIPYITIKANANFMHNDSAPLFRFGMSPNKLFDYLAAGRPIICDFYVKYNPIAQYKAGVTVNTGKVEDIANAIDNFSQNIPERLTLYGKNAREAAKEFDFKVLTGKLIDVIEGI